MKINKDYVYKHVLDSDILIDLKSNINGVIKLNKTSLDIYELVSKNYNKEEIINYLLNKYDSDINTITKDVDNFISDMIDKGIFIDEQ